LNAADGSEDNLIKIQGFDGIYSVDSDSDDESLSNLKKRRKLNYLGIEVLLQCSERIYGIVNSFLGHRDGNDFLNFD
jgi:hypothetical protein